MTFREKLVLEKERIAAQAKLNEAIAVARTAIGQMRQDADVFRIMAECKWMESLDPDSTGPRMVCNTNVTHLTKLADDLSARLEA